MVSYQIFDKGKLEKNNEYINYLHRITRHSTETHAPADTLFFLISHRYESQTRISEKAIGVAFEDLIRPVVRKMNFIKFDIS